MGLKLTWQGLAIYLTMLCFLVTASFLRARRKETADRIWLLGFLIAAVSVVYRGFHSGHLPMQNLFEVFLCMAAALWPISVLSRRFLKVDTVFQDALLGFILLWPAGFVFSEELRRLPPALQSPLFFPHVALYIVGYVMLARAAIISLSLFGKFDRTVEKASFVTAVSGFCPLSIGLVLGSYWGKIAWGHYWQWDPKEMWSLATWLIYIAYFHLRSRMGIRYPRLLAAFLWIGLLFIVLTLTWINISRMFKGMHNYAQ